MRIVVLSTLYPPIVVGGAEKAAALLAEGLARTGEDVIVISLHPGKEELQEERNGVRVNRLPMDNIYWPFAFSAEPKLAKLGWHMRDAWNRTAARRVGAILDREKPDVVHSHAIVGFSVAVWNEAKKRGIPLVHTTHDYYLLCLRSDMFPGGKNCGGDCLKCRVGTMLRQRMATKLDQAICVSEFVLNKHKARGYFQGVNAEQGFNVSAPVQMTPSNESFAPTIAASGVLVFGFIGRLDASKGIQVLLAATKLLRRSNWRLRIAGAGLPEFVDRLKLTYEDPKTEWLGYADVTEFYASIQTLVVPSVWEEPLGYVTIEALERGKSVIAARSGGIPEIGALGRVVETYPAENIAALAAAMDQAMENVECWSTGGFMEPDTAERFDATTIIGQHKERYRQAIAKVAAET